jgi:single-stranded DNA-binding protein
VRKGIMVGVSGEVDLDSWTDRQSGEKRQQLKITANDLRLLSSKQDGNAPATGSAASAAPSPGDDEPLF